MLYAALVTLVGPDYRIPAVPNVICLSGGGLAPDRLCLHLAPWQEWAGECFGVARWLFPRTAVGTPVEIRP
ncbi:L,D-transpeptidase [Synechococcus sp. RedBA-s]|uniref:L,D-transpeptidase n=1 Tax=Synechococcus sp. RedBA-s TaxID=2823741 RepID=UPI0020CCD0E1|nr:L,D-transpeptidase [Synechococcus sp. RedBA-s]